MCRYGFIRTCSFVQSEVLGATWSDRTLMFGRVAALLGIKESTLFSKNIVVHLFVFIYPFCYNTPFFFFLPTLLLMKFLLSILLSTTPPESSLAAPVKHCTDCSYKNLLVHTRSLPMPSLHISLWEVMWVSLDSLKINVHLGRFFLWSF